MEKHYNLKFLGEYYGDDIPAMKEILRLYVSETPGQLKQIEGFLQEGNTKRVKEATHKIKMNIAMLGITDSAEFIYAMHQLNAEDVLPGTVQTAFGSFKSEVQRALDEIQKDFFGEI